MGLDLAVRVWGLGFRDRARVNPKPETGVSTGMCFFVGPLMGFHESKNPTRGLLLVGPLFRFHVCWAWDLKKMYNHRVKAMRRTVYLGIIRANLGQVRGT